MCACACYVLDFLKDISNFLLRSNLCVCAQAFFIFLPEQKEKLVHYFIALFFSARKSLTKYLFGYRFGLPADRVWISVYEDDDEAFEIWRDEVSQTRDHN